MNKLAGLTIATAIFIATFLMTTAIVTSNIHNQTHNISQQQNIQEMVDEITNDLSTYIKIEDVIGKYSTRNEHQRIYKIALLIEPLVSCNLPLSDILIELSNRNDIKLLSFSNQADSIGSNSLFDHPLWKTIDHNTFSVLVTHDTDQSIINYQVINKNTDMAFIIIDLPDEFSMKNGDSLSLTLRPSIGMKRTITLEAPLPIGDIVNFD